jgi:hypothetical protein
MWSRTLKCSMKSHVTGLSTICFFFPWILIHVDLHTWSNRNNQRWWVFGVPWCPGFMLGWLPRGCFWKIIQVIHETWSIWCHVGIHTHFYIYLATFTHSVGPSKRSVKRELGSVPPSPPMRVLEVEWSGALSLVCEVAFTMSAFNGGGDYPSFVNSLSVGCLPCPAVAWTAQPVRWEEFEWEIPVLTYYVYHYHTPPPLLLPLLLLLLHTTTPTSVPLQFTLLHPSVRVVIIMICHYNLHPRMTYDAHPSWIPIYHLSNSHSRSFTHALITPNFPSGSTMRLLGIMFQK